MNGDAVEEISSPRRMVGIYSGRKAGLQAWGSLRFYLYNKVMRVPRYIGVDNIDADADADVSMDWEGQNMHNEQEQRKSPASRRPGSCLRGVDMSDFSYSAKQVFS